MNTPAATPASGPADASASLAARLATVRLGIRSDLEITRHIFRGEPSYVLRDPVTFRTHRLDAADYRIFAQIQPSQTLREIFSDLVRDRRLAAEDEPHFYQFILTLHRLGFAALPVSDEKLLYQRHQAKEQARRRARLLSLLFLRIPLVNPDRFLERTRTLAEPLFSRWILPFWGMLVAAAGYVAVQRREDLVAPLEGLLVTQNLPLLWLTLIVLKTFHEFGHAYACKRFGGCVPEMGAYLIMFTPCAYVDATASWSFTRKHDRLIVCLAGMYVESYFAAAAVFVWALTGPSLIHDVAFNVIFFASTITVLFNINPLMRYDGYYILADLLEIPNLRQRAAQHIADIAKRRLLGVSVPRTPLPRRLQWILTLYGACATLYRATLLVGIAAVIASKILIVGLVLAVVYLGSTLYGMIGRLTRYLWYSEETRAVRPRAVVVSLATLTLAPALFMLAPAPHPVSAAAVVARAGERVLHAPQSGCVIEAPHHAGDHVAAGEPVVRISNDSLVESAAQAAADLEACRIRQDAYRERLPARMMEEQRRDVALQRDATRRREALNELVLRDARGGQLLSTLGPADLGRFVERGQPIAMIGDGAWQVRTILDEEQLTDVRPGVGDRVQFRTADLAGRVIGGRIVKINPSGSRRVKLASLAAQHGGEVAVQPQTQEARQPYFELTIELDESPPDLRHGLTGRVRFDADPQPLGRSMIRGVMRFLHKLGAE